MDYRSCKFPKLITAPQSLRSLFSRKSGFSLIEVLIALVLFAVGMLGLGGMQLISIRGNAFSQKITQATVLTQNKLEELKRLPFVDSSLSIGRHDEGTLGSSTFSRSYDVEDVSTTLKAVTVTVRWTEEIDHSISLSTMKAK